MHLRTHQKIYGHLKQILEEEILFQPSGQRETVDFPHDGVFLDSVSDGRPRLAFQRGRIFIPLTNFLQQRHIFAVHLDIGAGIQPRLLAQITSGFEESARHVVVAALHRDSKRRLGNVFVNVGFGKLAEFVDVAAVHDEQLDDEMVAFVGGDPERSDSAFRRQIRIAAVFQ